MIWTTLTQILTSWLTKLASRKFLEWALLKCAEMYVKSTKTSADDEWYAKIREVIRDGR